MPSRACRAHPAAVHLLAALSLLASLLAACSRDGASPDAAGIEDARPAGPGPHDPDLRSPSAPVPRTETLRADLAPFYDLVVQGRTGAARVRLRKRLNLDPDDGQAAFLFGLSYHREKRYALARPYFDRALVDAPGYTTTHYFLGWALYYLGQPDDARRAFETHLASAPDEGDTHFGLGLLDLDDDRTEDAARRFRRAIALQTDRPDRVKELSKSHALLADVLMRQGEWNAARAELEIATALHPDHYAAFYRLYRVHLRLGDRVAADEAKAAFLAARRRLYPETRFPE